MPRKRTAPARISLVVDYDELDSLNDAIDYISKVTWGVTQLNSFEAGYSKPNPVCASLRTVTVGKSAVNTFIQFGGLPGFKSVWTN